MSGIILLSLLAPALFLTAYAMVSLGRWPSSDPRFHGCNLLGALLMLLSLSEQWNLPVCLLEGCWAAISMYGLLRGNRHGTHL